MLGLFLTTTLERVYMLCYDSSTYTKFVNFSSRYYVQMRTLFHIHNNHLLDRNLVVVQTVQQYKQCEK